MYTIESMNRKQYARWLALFEGVNYIAEAAEKKGKNFNKLNIHQPALEAYVNSTGPSIEKNLELEELNEIKVIK